MNKENLQIKARIDHILAWKHLLLFAKVILSIKTNALIASSANNTISKPIKINDRLRKDLFVFFISLKCFQTSYKI